jgi:hypothetical protein
MNEQNSGERFFNWDTARRTERDTNSLLTESEPVTDPVPVEAALIHETAETPMVGAVAAVGSMREAIAHEAPMAEMMPYKAPVGEPVADESGVGESPYIAPLGETATHAAPIMGTNAGSSAALLSHEESEHFRTRWNEIQGKFVDEPRSAVQQADALVSEVVEEMTRMFANEHGLLKSQWNQGSDVSTEDLRKALQRYRTFFNRLVT